MHNCIKFNDNEMLEKAANSMLFVRYIVYTERQKACTTFSFDFFWIKIDDFKNQYSLVFMPVQKTIVVEEI